MGGQERNLQVQGLVAVVAGLLEQAVMLLLVEEAVATEALVQHQRLAEAALLMQGVVAVEQEVLHQQ
jgi:hypothetical protein